MTFGFGGCHNTPETPVTPPNPTTAGGTPPTSADTGTSGGTTPSNPSSAKKEIVYEPFNGENAYTILKKQCEFGVRPLGTPAHEKTKEYLSAEMRKYADTTIIQSFAYHDMPVTNIIGVFNPAGSDKPSDKPILLMAHWDTRPIADGPYSDKRNVLYRYGSQGWKPTHPIMGANDAASGVAVLLEIARILHKQKPAVGVLLLLDDGEDYGDFHADNDKGDGIELGSIYFAEHFKENPAFGHPFYGILLDMVGGKGATFPREQFSEQYAKIVNDKIFTTADQLGYGKVFLTNVKQAVGDDHVAINLAGIRMADVIHPLPHGGNQSGDAAAYRYWHTLQDTPDKCSPQTLKIVGDVVLKVLYSEGP